VIVNDLLQEKLNRARLIRHVWCSTALRHTRPDRRRNTHGHPKHKEDFGQTFAVWGFGEGWYLVLPVLRPSTVRDTVGLPPESALDPVARHDEVRERNSLYALRSIDRRARLLGASEVRDTAALDEYLFTRDAYRQHRWNLIYDGNPPQMSFEDEDEEDDD